MWNDLDDFADDVAALIDRATAIIMAFVVDVIAVAGEALDTLEQFIADIDFSALERDLLRELPFVFFVALLVVLLFAWRRLRARKPDRSLELIRMTKAPRALGYLTGLIFFVGLGAWSAVALLASAAIAPGIISPDGYRKTVQHLEGGIIHSIHVREGDAVEAGQVLVSLKETTARGRLDELRGRYLHFAATEARLIAEQIDAGEIAFPSELMAFGSEQAENTAASQVALFRSRRETRQGREQVLRQRIKQIEEQINGLHAVIDSQARQIELIQQEIDGARDLYEQGLGRLPRLLALERAQAELQAEQASNRAEIARSRQQIGETEIQLLTMRQQDKEAVNEELTKVRTALAELRSQLPSRQDMLERTAITAPISGTVMDLRVTTEQGVVAAGQPILDVVPLAPDLVIDARVRPEDIDMVYPGLTARVLLSAYRQRHLPRIHGVVRSVSADRLVDERTGEPYFLAKVEVDPGELSRLEDVQLSAGMPAEVMILTGEQTFLAYLLGPLTESMTKSFREQ